MRMLAATFFGVTLLLASGGAQAQNKCKDGTAATVTGVIGSIQQFRPEPGVNIWVLKAQGRFGGNCFVEQVWGDGPAPASCTAGKKFSASGRAVDADSFWMLQSTGITCN